MNPNNLNFIGICQPNYVTSINYKHQILVTLQSKFLNFESEIFDKVYSERNKIRFIMSIDIKCSDIDELYTLELIHLDITNKEN